MLKKVLSLSVFLGIIFTTIPCNIVQANEISVISSDTIITEDNIFEVLDYFSIVSSNIDLTKTNTEGAGVKTVGELEELISQVKNLPSNIAYEGKQLLIL